MCVYTSVQLGAFENKREDIIEVGWLASRKEGFCTCIYVEDIYNNNNNKKNTIQGHDGDWMYGG